MIIALSAMEEAVYLRLLDAMKTAETDFGVVASVYNGVVPPDRIPESDADGPIAVFRLDETRGAEGTEGFDYDAKTFTLTVTLVVGRRRGSDELAALLDAIVGNGGAGSASTIGLHRHAFVVSGATCTPCVHVRTTTDHDQQVLIYLVDFEWFAFREE